MHRDNIINSVMDYHWRSQFHCCRLCEVDYEFVTHLEESSTEINFILKNLKIENLTSIAGQYSWSPAGSDYNRWQTIPRKTTIDIYRHYFADFVLFGLLILVQNIFPVFRDAVIKHKLQIFVYFLI